jgi:hypothetical protein
MKKANKKQKGLSDTELIAKYENGKIDFKKVLKPVLKERDTENLKAIKSR